MSEKIKKEKNLGIVSNSKNLHWDVKTRNQCQKHKKKRKKNLALCPEQFVLGCPRKRKKRKKENRKKEKNLGMVASTNSVEEVTERLRDVRG